MLITNGTDESIRISQFHQVSEDEMIEVFAWVIGKGNSLNVQLNADDIITITQEKLNERRKK